MDSEGGRNAVMLRLYRATSSPDVTTRWKAYEVFNYVSTANYIHLNNYVPLLVQRTVETLPKEEESVIIQLLAVWTSIAAMEDALEESGTPHHNLVATHGVQLVPLFLEVLSTPTDPDLVEMETPPPKNPHMAALLTLWAFSKVLHEDTAMPLFATFIGKYLPTTCKAWYRRKAAIAAIAIVAIFDSAQTLVMSSLGLIIEAGITSLSGYSSNTQLESPSNSSNSAKPIFSENDAVRCLSLSESASFAIQRISEYSTPDLEDQWGAIVQWMAKLDVTKKGEYIILGNLLDALIAYVTYPYEDSEVLESLEPHIPQLLSLFQTWTSKKEILHPLLQCRLLVESFESITDLCKDETQLLDRETMECICLNMLELLETVPVQNAKIAGTIFGVFNSTVFSVVSAPTAARAIRSCFSRIEQSDNMEEVQAAFILLHCAVSELKQNFVPFVEQTCKIITGIVERKGVFSEADELAIIPVSDMLPEDTESSDDEEEFAEPLNGANEALSLEKKSKQNGSDLESSKPVESANSSAHLIASLTASDMFSSIDTTGGHLRTQRQEDISKSLAVSAKNIAVEDAMRLLEQVMNWLPQEATKPFVNELQVCLLQLALRVPPSFTSVLSTLALSLASTIRVHGDTADIYLSPLFKLTEKVTKTGLASSEAANAVIFSPLLSCFSSAILSADPSNSNHISIVSDALESILSLIKASMKDDVLEDDPDLPATCAALIGDYAKIAKPSDPSIQNRLFSTFEMILQKWDNPNQAVISYVSENLQGLKK